LLLTKEQLDRLQSKIRSDCQLLFADLPGVCSQPFTPDRVFELTGMKVSCQTDEKNQQQIFTIDSGADEIFHEDSCGIRAARKGNITLLLLKDSLHSLLMEMMKKYGVKSIIETEGVVHGNKKLLGVFSTKENGIHGKVSLPQKTDWYEWFTKTEYLSADTVDIDISPKEARVFIAKDLLQD